MKTKFLVSSFIFFFLFTGCKKYQDDADIHLRSAKARLCIANGLVYCTNPGNPGNMIFRKDGTVLYENFINIYNGGLITLKWEFIEHKNAIRFTNPNDNMTYDFSILRLDLSYGDEIMVLQNDTALFHFVGAE